MKNEHLIKLLSDGGDERQNLNSQGLNKYNINPSLPNTYFNRGSCTCSPITDDAFIHLNEVVDDLKSNFESFRANHTQELRQQLKLSEQTEIFYAPSGSDLCYYPLLFSKLNEPNKDILTILTCPEELGSGSLLAYEGKYYFQENQFNETKEKGSFISDKIRIKNLQLRARDEQGNILDHSAKIKELVHEHKEAYAIVVNLVIGSKSGIEDNLKIIDELADENVIWVIDMCQFRNENVIINRLLNKKCSIMLTGSKFYQAPPFCGVLLVPGEVVSNSSKNQYVAEFNSIFSKQDVPNSMSWRNELKAFNNVSLLSRWECAIFEMKALSEFSTVEIETLILDWNHFVNGLLKVNELFELMPHQERTNNSIISFRINKDGRYLDYDELKKIYTKFCTTKINLYQRRQLIPLIGQPVKYGEKAFLRIALGSQNIRAELNMQNKFLNDEIIIKKLSECIQSMSF